MKHAIAIAALVATSVGAIALPVVAQGTTQIDTTQAVARKADREIHRMMPRGGGARSGTVVNLVCSDRGAEALEIAFVRLSHRLDLTAEQQPLFDALRTSALTAQTTFADTCVAAQPAAADAGSAAIVARLKTRLTIEQARLDAMTGLLPDLEAFYASLTDAQKAGLQPRRGFFRHGPGANAAPDARTAPDRAAPDRAAPGRDAPGRDAPGRTDRAPAPGRG